MITLGIAGGMGSGKSFVCRILEEKHIPVFICDKEVKSIFNDKNRELMHKLIELCGEECYTTDDKWNVKYIATLAETDKTILDRISLIIKPYLLQSIKQFKITHKDEPFCAVESALFPKSESLRNTVDKMVMVATPLETRIKRIKERDPHRSDNDIIVLLCNQIAPNINFDYILYNGEREELDIADQIHSMLIELA